jgi:hypothetical protein
MDSKVFIKKTEEVMGEALVNVSSCDACYSAELKPEAVLNIMPVSIHLGVMEPSEYIEDFEYIINDGVFRDYERNKAVVLSNNNDSNRSPQTERIPSRCGGDSSRCGGSLSSCGGNSSGCGGWLSRC